MFQKDSLYFAELLLTSILIVSLWQLELVHIAPLLEWGYDFGGLGQLGLELWAWRDFWYIVIFANYILTVAVLHTVLQRDNVEGLDLRKLELYNIE